ncbi:MAG TPA: SDR family NAD(P)-dependent oxidoreductase [Pseudomonadales bacterium]
MKVLIIGATSAVARAVALRLAADGAQMYWLARNPHGLQQALAGLESSVRGSACYDFCDTAQAAQAVENAWQCLDGIDRVLIAHGMLPDQLRTEHDITLAEQTIASNLTSVIAFLLPLVQQMQAQGHGQIGVISSVAGDRGRPRNFTYAAAKGGLSVYLQGLRSTLWQSGVEIYTFRLGPVDTPMTASHQKNFSFASVDQVADVIVRAFAGRRYDIYVPGFWRWVMLVVRMLPEWLFQRLAFLSAR